MSKLSKFYFKEDSNFLNSNQKKFIENVIQGEHFPFYLNKGSVIGDGNASLFHIVKKRPEDGGEWNNNVKEYFIDILNTFCTKNNIKYKQIIRCAVNLTFKNKDKKCPTHKDHTFNHKQLILYLNNPLDKKSTTILLKNNKIYKEIKPEKFKGICFDNIEHYHYFPKKGHRLVLVYTFN